MDHTWGQLIERESAKDYWAKLQEFVEAERTRAAVYPPPREVFAALELTPYDKVEAVILGQDPYHGPGEAHGLCFSVRDGVTIPPSLRNIFKELEADLGCLPPSNGSLEHWARQGVLLLNTSLTVRANDAGSHAGQGWERFTDEVLRTVNGKAEPVVFILWGGHARRKKNLIAEHHHVIESAHPSPLAAWRGFHGSKPFSRTNEFLRRTGRDPIDWRIPNR